MAGVTEQDDDLVVTEVDPDGRALLEWTFHPDAAGARGRRDVRAGRTLEQKMADAIGTLRGTSRMTPRGVSFDASSRATATSGPRPSSS